MISVNYAGRLGNNIFQYCFGRILAEELGYMMNKNLSEFEYAKEVNGLNFNSPIEVLEGHQIDLDGIVSNKNPRAIILNGFFQRSEYFIKYKDKINEWLSLKNKNFKKPNEYDLVVHVRGGDLLNQNPNCNHVPAPLYYYTNIIDSSKYEKLYIVCESPNDIIAKELNSIYPDSEIISQSPIEDYYFINHSKYIVLSLSSLSWWAAFLSDAKKIYFPMTGFWHPKGERKDVNLLVNEYRYVYCDLGVKDDWISSKEQIDSLLIKNKNFEYYTYDQTI